MIISRAAELLKKTAAPVAPPVEVLPPSPELDDAPPLPGPLASPAAAPAPTSATAPAVTRPWSVRTARRAGSRPPVLPRLSTAAAALTRRACRPRRPVSAEVGESAVALVPSGPLRATAERAGGVGFTLIVAGDAFAARLPMHALESLAAAAQLPVPRAAVLDDLAALLAEAALEPLLQRLEQTTGVDWLIAAADAAVLGPRPWWLTLPLRVGDSVPVSLSVGGELAAVERLVRWLDRCPPAPPRVADMPLALRAGIAEVVLDRGELSGLAPGDVVLADVPIARRAEARLLLPGHGAWPARVAAGRLEITGPCDRRENSGGGQNATMTDSSSDRITVRPAAAAPGDVARVAVPDDGPLQVPVTVGFEVGRLTLTIAEIAAIAPGAVFPLQPWADDGVDLVAGGKRIGRGEIVDIDGWLGVRITRVADDDGL